MIYLFQIACFSFLAESCPNFSEELIEEFSVEKIKDFKDFGKETE